MEEHNFKKGDFVQFSYRHDHATKLVGSIINILTNTIVVDIDNSEDLPHIEPRQVVRINNCKKVTMV
ncbi:TPA: methyltransferase [Bacillus paranthracis]